MRADTHLHMCFPPVFLSALVPALMSSAPHLAFPNYHHCEGRCSQYCSLLSHGAPYKSREVPSDPPLRRHRLPYPSPYPHPVRVHTSGLCASPATNNSAVQTNARKVHFMKHTRTHTQDTFPDPSPIYLFWSPFISGCRTFWKWHGYFRRNLMYVIFTILAGAVSIHLASGRIICTE